MNNSPKLKFSELREYESKGGRRYFAGYLGKLKLLMFEDRNAELIGSEVSRWTIFAEEVPDRRPAVTVTLPGWPDGLRARARATLLERVLDPSRPDPNDPPPF
jgi:hypothetical protein